MNKFIAMLSLFVTQMILGILVLIHGWGLEVKSWWWVIGVGIIIRLLIEISLTISKEK